MATRMQQRRGTAAQWTAANPILAAGEIGFETDTSKFKMGNGSSVWSSLTYFANAAELAAIVDGAPDLLNTLNELAASIGDNPNFIGTVTSHTTATTSVHGIANTADLSTKSFANAAANDYTVAHNNSTTLVHGIANTALLATQTDISDTEDYADSAVSSHASVSTNVHGIDDFSLLATTAEVGTAISDAVDYHSDVTINVHGIADTAELATTTEVGTAVADGISVHSSDTSNVHGITDTTVLATNSSVAAAIDDFSELTTSIHGIADTAVLATNSSVAAAISDFSGLTTSIHGIADTGALATKTYADGSVTTHSSDTTQIHGIENTALLATKEYADTAVSTHASDTLDVHGIANTALLATQDYVDTAIGTATVDQSALAGVGLNWNGTSEAFDIDSTVATTTYVATEIGTHNSDTTNVHGIADTALLALKSEVAAVTKTSLGLGNVDNTSDASKPVSTAQSTAIATAKAEAIADATAQVNALLTGAPAALNTLDELAAALGDDANFAATVTTNLGLKVDSLTPISQKTASYTLSSLTERDDLIEMGSASPITLSIPTDATLNYPIGTSIDILQTGAGQVTIAAVTPGTTTVNATPGLKLRTTWSSCTLFKRAANTWVVYGDLTA